MNKLNIYLTIYIERLTFPMAKRPLSNKNKTPIVRKNTPKLERPIPISNIKILKGFTHLKINKRSLQIITLNICKNHLNE